MSEIRLSDDFNTDDVRKANEASRARIWAIWVAKFGNEEASRRWLKIFAATDATHT